MIDSIDYSRPVGWWCRMHQCDILDWGCDCELMQVDAIPRYLEIPKGRRPPAASKVKDAEAVTSYSAPSSSTPWTVVRRGLERGETVREGMDLAETIQRIVAGETE